MKWGNTCWTLHTAKSLNFSLNIAKDRTDPVVKWYWANLRLKWNCPNREWGKCHFRKWKKWFLTPMPPWKAWQSNGGFSSLKITFLSHVTKANKGCSFDIHLLWTACHLITNVIYKGNIGSFEWCRRNRSRGRTWMLMDPRKRTQCFDRVAQNQRRTHS